MRCQCWLRAFKQPAPLLRGPSTDLLQVFAHDTIPGSGHKTVLALVSRAQEVQGRKAEECAYPLPPEVVQLSLCRGRILRRLRPTIQPLHLLLRAPILQQLLLPPEQVLPLLEPQLLPGLGFVQGLLVRFQPPLPARNDSVASHVRWEGSVQDAR